MSAKPLFVLGLPNTATSTLVAILNSHPEVLVCYETWMLPPLLTHYTWQICQCFPEIRKCYSGNRNILESFAHMGDIFADRGIRYKYLGDKLVSFTLNEMKDLSVAHVIYVTRPIKEWLIKREVRRSYDTNLDAVTPCLHYLRCLAIAMSQPNWFRVTIQNLIDEPSVFISNIADYLGLNAGDFDQNWWKSLLHYNDPIKNSMKWAERHPSSLLPPQKRADNSYSLSNHPFWSDIVPIENYLNGQYTTGLTNQEFYDVSTQIDVLADKYSYIPLKNLYLKFSEKRHVPKQSLNNKIKNTYQNLLQLIK